jgi:hypothetical protein
MLVYYQQMLNRHYYSCIRMHANDSREAHVIAGDLPHSGCCWLVEDQPSSARGAVLNDQHHRMLKVPACKSAVFNVN